VKRSRRDRIAVEYGSANRRDETTALPISVKIAYLRH